MNKPQPQPLTLNQKVTTPQLANHFQVTSRTIANWRARGLPRIRINARTIRYDLREVEKFLAS